MKRYLTILFIVLAGLSNAVMDTDKCCYSSSILKPKQLDTKFKIAWDNWANEQSWTNKWKNHDPAQGEAFFGSSTFLVLITDLWHFAQALMLTFFALAIVYYIKFTRWKLLDAIIIKIVFSLSFEFLWRILRKKKIL